MRLVLQRVSSAAVRVDGETIGAIGPGLLVLVGVREGAVEGTARRLAAKTAALRALPARREVAGPRGEASAAALEALGVRVARGRFGAKMEVELVNDGPVTLVIDSAELERPRRA